MITLMVFGQIFTGNSVNAIANAFSASTVSSKKVSSSELASSTTKKTSDNLSNLSKNGMETFNTKKTIGSQSKITKANVTRKYSSTSSQNIFINGLGSNDAREDQGKESDASNWTEGSSHDLHYDFSINDGTAIKSGDTSTLTLPDGAVFANNESFDIKDENGNIIGHFEAKVGESTGIITWSNYYAVHPNDRHGIINLVVTGIIPLPSNVVYINKNGWVINQGTDGNYKQVQWELRVNPKNNVINNVKISDTVENVDTQTIDKGSFSVKYTDSGEVVPENQYTLNITNNGFTLAFNADINKDIRVLYTTTLVSGIPYLIDGTKMTFSNKVAMSGQDITNNKNVSDTSAKDVVVGNNGSGSGAAKGVILTKKDSETGNSIPETHFKLVDSNNTTIQDDLVTDQYGQIHLDNMKDGTYYLVETQAANGYVINTTPQKFTITDDQQSPSIIMFNNDPQPKTTNVSGTKTWQDNDDQDGKRPSSIMVNLLANGKEVQSQKVSSNDHWQYNFKDLPKYEDGVAINYTVTEDKVADYTTKIDGTNLINSYTPKQTGVTVTKAWNDSNNQDRLRPNSIKVQLYGDNVKVGNEVTLTSGENWTHSWAKLPINDRGKTIKYTVKEVGTATGYTATINDTNTGNIMITNSHTPKKHNVTPPNKKTTVHKLTSKIRPWLVKHHFLPQTNEQYASYFVSFGLALLVVILIIVLVIIRRRNSYK